MTSRDTLPSSALFRPDIPRWPMTIAGASSSSAVAAMSSPVGAVGHEQHRLRREPGLARERDAGLDHVLGVGLVAHRRVDAPAGHRLGDPQ